MSRKEQPVTSAHPEPRVRIYGDFVRAIESLRADKRLRFYGAVLRYAFGIDNEQPDFSDDELAEVWRHTTVRVCTDSKHGYIKYKGGHGDGE